MIGYNNISRPVHDPPQPLATPRPLATPSNPFPKSGGSPTPWIDVPASIKEMEIGNCLTLDGAYLHDNQTISIAKYVGNRLRIDQINDMENTMQMEKRNTYSVHVLVRKEDFGRYWITQSSIVCH